MSRSGRYRYGERIRLLRLGKGLTQKQMAEKFGVSRTSVSDYECGRAIPPIRFWIKMAYAWNVSLDVMILFKDEPNDPTATKRQFARYRRVLSL